MVACLMTKKEQSGGTVDCFCFYTLFIVVWLEEKRDVMLVARHEFYDLDFLKVINDLAWPLTVSQSEG